MVNKYFNTNSSRLIDIYIALGILKALLTGVTFQDI